MNKNQWTIVAVITSVLITISVVGYYGNIQIIPVPPSVSRHVFKVQEIYPTKQGGREWFINMANPTINGIFDPGSTISRQPDGSWQINGKFRPGNKYEDQVRMTVGTPEGKDQWKNVEITGYAKILSADSDTDHLDWYARGGIHSSDVPCVGSALKGTISVNGKVSWVKEIWHTGGYTRPRDMHQVSNSILGKWIGWKVVMYNINDNTAVKMESYLDNNDNNHWRKVSQIVDSGGWYAKSSDEEFYSAGCGRAKDYVITNSGPLVTFRSDNMVWDFADLSVREIQPPPLPQ
jgi:hypothetical protein